VSRDKPRRLKEVRERETMTKSEKVERERETFAKEITNFVLSVMKTSPAKRFLNATSIMLASLLRDIKSNYVAA